MEVTQPGFGEAARPEASPYREASQRLHELLLDVDSVLEEHLRRKDVARGLACRRTPEAVGGELLHRDERRVAPVREIGCR